MIVITAPTGQIGRQLINNLLDSDESLRVIARDPARLPAPVRRRAEVVQGSHQDPGVVDRAFAGADAVFWLRPPEPTAADARAANLAFTEPACRAIADHRVPRVVTVSALGRGVTTEAGLVSLAWQTDDRIAATGAAVRSLALPGFMDNLLRQTVSIAADGVIAEPLSPDRRRPYCATRDIAAVAAELLLDHGWTGNRARAVLGPQDLSQAEMASIVSEVIGRPVRFVPIPVETYRTQLIAHGFSASMAEQMVAMAVAKENGLDNAEPRTAESTSPTTFRTWCEEVLKPALPAAG